MAHEEGTSESAIERAKVLADSGRLDDAVSVLDKALVHAHEDSDLLLWLAVYSINDAEAAAGYVRRSAAASAGDPSRLTQCARLMLTLDSYDDARSFAVAAGKQAGGGFPLANELVYVFGRLAEAEGDDDRAERFLRLAFEDAPDVPEHALALAEFLRARGRSAEARAVVSQVRSLHSGHVALSELDRSLHSDPETP